MIFFFFFGDSIKFSICAHRVPVSVFAHYVEQIAYCSDHNSCLSTVSNHRVCFSATRCPVREHCGVKTDEYVFHQAFRRLFVHFVLNKFKKIHNSTTFIVILVHQNLISTMSLYIIEARKVR